jgi:hypothetical protein
MVETSVSSRQIGDQAPGEGDGQRVIRAETTPEPRSNGEEGVETRNWVSSAELGDFDDNLLFRCRQITLGRV